MLLFDMLQARENKAGVIKGLDLRTARTLYTYASTGRLKNHNNPNSREAIRKWGPDVPMGYKYPIPPIEDAYNSMLLAMPGNRSDESFNNQRAKHYAYREAMQIEEKRGASKTFIPSKVNVERNGVSGKEKINAGHKPGFQEDDRTTRLIRELTDKWVNNPEMGIYADMYGIKAANQIYREKQLAKKNGWSR